MMQTTKLKEKISIEEFDGKRFQIRMIEPDLLNQKKAALTHYLHNINNGVSKYFKADAEAAINEYIIYKNEEQHVAIAAEAALQRLLFEVENVPFPTPKNYTFKFIDLFAGIGGFRLAMQNLGGKCVYTSEWDKEAQKTYRANFGEVPFGDITKEQTKKYIPDEFIIPVFESSAQEHFSKSNNYENTAENSLAFRHLSLKRKMFSAFL